MAAILTELISEDQSKSPGLKNRIVVQPVVHAFIQSKNGSITFTQASKFAAPVALALHRSFSSLLAREGALNVFGCAMQARWFLNEGRPER